MKKLCCLLLALLLPCGALALEVSVTTLGSGANTSSSFTIGGEVYIANSSTGVVTVSYMDGYESGTVRLYPDGNYQVLPGTTLQPETTQVPTATQVPEAPAEPTAAPVALPEATRVPETAQPTTAPAATQVPEMPARQEQLPEATDVPTPAVTAAPAVTTDRLVFQNVELTQALYTPAGGQEQQVTTQVISVGITETTVTVNGFEITIPTTAVTFGADIPAEKKLAVLGSNQSSRIALKDGTGKSAENVAMVPAGTITAVLALDGDSVLVWADGETGYAKVKALDFTAAMPALGKGTVVWHEKTYGSVPLRLKEDKDALKMKNLPVGTEVTIVNQSRNWYELEVDGLRGYMMKENVHTDEEIK